MNHKLSKVELSSVSSLRCVDDKLYPLRLFPSHLHLPLFQILWNWKQYSSVCTGVRL